MKKFRISIIAVATLLAGFGMTACSEANEYEDSNTDNPSWIVGYTDTTTISHPESLESTKWVRGEDLKKNAYGKVIQGFVESLDFVSADSVAVKMSQGVTEGTWNDESNTAKLPYYEYTYSSKTGNLQILQRNVSNGKVTKKAIFIGVVVKGKKEIITLVHYGDSPAQTYLVKE